MTWKFRAKWLWNIRHYSVHILLILTIAIFNSFNPFCIAWGKYSWLGWFHERPHPLISRNFWVLKNQFFFWENIPLVVNNLALHFSVKSFSRKFSWKWFHGKWIFSRCHLDPGLAYRVCRKKCKLCMKDKPKPLSKY